MRQKMHRWTLCGIYTYGIRKRYIYIHMYIEIDDEESLDN